MESTFLQMAIGRRGLSAAETVNEVGPLPATRDDEKADTPPCRGALARSQLCFFTITERSGPRRLVGPLHPVHYPDNQGASCRQTVGRCGVVLFLAALTSSCSLTNECRWNRSSCMYDGKYESRVRKTTRNPRRSA